MDDNYQKLLDRISRASGVEKEEIERRVEAKRAKLSGLISKEGAAQVIAAELGISFDNEKLKINELVPGMRKVNVVGKVINIFPVREFSKNGKEGKVANFVIADDSGNIKVVLWDVNHINLIERGEIDNGKVVEVYNAGMRENELHLGSFSELKLSNEILEGVKTEKIVKEKKISDLKLQDSASIRAFIVQSFEPRFFYTCPICKKKVRQENEGFVCDEHKNVAGEKKALLNVVLDDGTETIRAVMFNEMVNALGLDEFNNPNLLAQQRQNILGKEMFFSGNVRLNKFFNNQEFIVDNLKEPDLDELIEKLEKNKN